MVKTLALRQVDPEKSFLYFGLLIYRHLISLFPVHTGVIHGQTVSYDPTFTIPRAYGGDPRVYGAIINFAGYSPCIRG